MTIMSGSAGEAAVQILDIHRYFRSRRCRCGLWLELTTETHAQHVLHQLQMAGLDVVWR